jgi:hypothetical protein
MQPRIRQLIIFPSKKTGPVILNSDCTQAHQKRDQAPMKKTGPVILNSDCTQVHQKRDQAPMKKFLTPPPLRQ